jgi:hypothetical protein
MNYESKIRLVPYNTGRTKAMARDWISVYAAGKTGWNIPDTALTELTAGKDGVPARRAGVPSFGANRRLSLYRNSSTLVELETAKNETTRTPAATAQCKKCLWGPMVSALIP